MYSDHVPLPPFLVFPSLPSFPNSLQVATSLLCQARPSQSHRRLIPFQRFYRPKITLGHGQREVKQSAYFQYLPRNRIDL